MRPEMTRGEFPVWFELFKAALTGQCMRGLSQQQTVINAVETADLAFEEYRKFEPHPRISEEKLKTIAKLTD